MLRIHPAANLDSLDGLVSRVCDNLDSLGGLVSHWFEVGLSVWRILAVVLPEDIVLWRLFFGGSGDSPGSSLLTATARRLTIVRYLLQRN